MKYFNLNISDNLDIIGVYPQISNTEKNIFGSPFSNRKVNYGDIPEEIPYLELEFNKNAKITDVLGTYNPYFGLIVSHKFKNIVSSFNLPNHRFYKANIIYQKDLLNYYWLNFHDDLRKYIDFSMTEIEIYNKFSFKILDTFILNSEATLDEVNLNLGIDESIRLKKISLKKGFPKYDIMTNNILGYGSNLISIKLMNSIKDSGITGFKFSELDYEIIVE